MLNNVTLWYYPSICDKYFPGSSFITVLVFYGYITNYDKFSGFKQHTYTISWLLWGWSLGVGWRHPPSGSVTKLKFRCQLGLWSYLRLRVLFIVPLFLTEFSLKVVGLKSLLSCWLSSWMFWALRGGPLFLTTWPLHSVAVCFFTASSRISSLEFLWPQESTVTLLFPWWGQIYIG